MPAGGDEKHQRFTLLAHGNAGWIPRASAVFITLFQAASGPEPDASTYSDYAEHGLGQAVAHLRLQARSLGLETHQFAGFDHDATATQFAVPFHYKVMAAIAVGHEGDAVVWGEVDKADRQRGLRARTRDPVVVP